MPPIRRRPLRLARSAGAASPATLEHLEPRVILSATGDAFELSQYIRFDTDTPLTDFAAADVNGDGIADIAAVDGNDLFLAPSFRGAYRLPVDLDVDANGFVAASHVEFADITGDGNLDIAVLESDSDSRFFTLIGNGRGGFSAPVVATTGLGEVNDWVVTDFNGDGRADFLYVQDDRVIGYAAATDGTATTQLFNETTMALAMNHIAIGDIDGDGTLDLVTVEANGNIFYALGQGAGAIDPLAGPRGPTTTSSVDIGLIDTNGDGRTDTLATLNGSSALETHTIESTFFGITFTQATTAFANKSNPENLQVGDVNGDGLPDIVSHASSTFSIFFGKPAQGGADYTTVSNYAVQESVDRTRLADINADGRLDVLGMTNRSIHIAPNLGNATFAVPEVTVGGAGNDDRPDRAIFGDLDGDNVPDAILFDTVVNRTQDLRIYTGYAGRYSAGAATIASAAGPGTGIDAVVLSDTDGDGDNDIVVIWNDGTRTLSQVHRNEGDLNFTTLDSRIILGKVISVGGIWGGALNGGSKQDVLVGDLNSNRLIVLAGQGTGNLFLIDRVRIGAAPRAIEVADLDGDTDRDIALATNIGVSYIAATGNFVYGPRKDTAFTSGARDIAVGNHNADTLPDVAAIVGAGYGEFVFLRNRSFMQDELTFRHLPQSDFILGATPYDRIAQGDLNGDGTPDFLLTAFNDEPGYVTINGNGFLGTAEAAYYQPNGDNPSGPYDAALLDVDQDGDLDITILSNVGVVDRAGVFISRNRGDGSFILPDLGSSSISTRVPSPPHIGQSRSTIGTGDFNNDGLTDLVAHEADFRGENLAVYLNTGNGFRRAALVATADSGDSIALRQLAVGDVTGDGLDDIVVYNESDLRHYVLVNDGDGSSFTRILAHSQADFTYSALSLADMTGDGILDIVATDDTNDFVVIMPGRNDGTFRNGAVRSVINVPNIESGDRPHIFDGDGDGLLDFAIVRDGADDIRFHRQRDARIFEFSTIWTAPISGQIGQVLSSADLNGDGRPELLVGQGSITAQFSILFNTSAPGSPSFTQADYGFPIRMEADDGILAGDIDNDGRTELLILGSALTAVELNAAGVPVSFVSMSSEADGQFAPMLQDLDNDGDLDFLATGRDFRESAGSLIHPNAINNTYRISNSTPFVPGAEITLDPLRIGDTADITLETLLDRAGVVDTDGDTAFTFRIVEQVSGTLSGPAGIRVGNRPLTSGVTLTYQLASDAVGTPIAFRVQIADQFAEGPTIIDVRVPIAPATIIASTPPAPPPPTETSAGWLDFDPLGLELETPSDSDNQPDIHWLARA